MNRKGVLAGVLWLALAAPETALGGPESTDRIIVKFSDHAARASARGVMVQERVEALAVQVGVPGLSHLRNTAAGAQILQLPSAVPLDQAESLSRRMQGIKEVLYAQPDYRIYPLQVPNDPHYPVQWALADAASQPGAIGAPAAWEISTGDPEVAVAVIDTGVLDHEDLVGRFLARAINGQPIPYGWDFIGRDADGSHSTANDGDGPDADPRDPGDWVTAAESSSEPFLGCRVTDSTWHGTHVAGILGASSNNATGVTGVDWESAVLPVRVLGKCGGYLSDVFDGVRWAAGLEVDSLCANGTIPRCTEPPRNEHPARVINLSLGASRDCGAFEQEAIDAVRAAGAVVVAAAGNSASATVTTPASCKGVIAVAAIGRSGDLAYYSNYGASIDIAAPGGDPPHNPEGIYSALDGGDSDPQNDNKYAYYIGTSMAAPHVSGTLALMLAANHSEREAVGRSGWLSPKILEAKLKGAARAFPKSGNCTTSLCGAGLLDAGEAVRAVSTPPIAVAEDQLVGVGDTVALDGSASHDDGRITRFHWESLDAESPALEPNSDGSVARFDTTGMEEGLLRFRVTVTDDVGLQGSTEATVTISATVPDLEPIANRTLTLGESIELEVRATQADGGVPVLSLVSPPAGAWLTDFGNGTGRFEWLPEKSGTFEVSFEARNPDNSDYKDVERATFSVRSPLTASTEESTETSGGGGGGAAVWLICLSGGFLLARRFRARNQVGRRFRKGTGKRPTRAP